MLTTNPFYHGIVRKSIVAFGSLFSNIQIDRKDNGSVDGDTLQRIKVPIAYAPKEKWVVRIDSDPSLTNHVYTVLPVMSFEITGMSYDTTRKMNRMNKITCYDGNGMKSTHVPVPYNIDITMYVIAKTQEDVLQIIEQIFPYFTPDYNLKIKVVPETNTFIDVPVVLNSVAVQDDYDGDFQTRRFVTYTLNFTMKANLFGPVDSGGVIEDTTVNVSGVKLTHTAHGDTETGEITEEWIEGF